MPQLMPLFWLMYMFIFFVLIFMMKSVYSIYVMSGLKLDQNQMKLYKNLWFW